MFIVIHAQAAQVIGGVRSRKCRHKLLVYLKREQS